MSYRGILKNTNSPGQRSAPPEYPQASASGFNPYYQSPSPGFSTGTGINTQQAYDGPYVSSASSVHQQTPQPKPLSDINVELLAKAIAEKTKLGLLGGPSDASRPSAALAALQCYEDGRLSPPPPQTVTLSPSPQPSVSSLTSIFSPQSSASDKDKFWKTLLTYAIEGGKGESPFSDDRLRSFSPMSASSDHLSDAKKIPYEEESAAKGRNTGAQMLFQNIDDEDEFLYGDSDVAPNAEESPPKLVKESPPIVKPSLGDWSGDDSSSQVFKASISALNALKQLGEDFSPRLSPNNGRGQSDLPVSRPMAKNQISINLNLPQSISKECSEWEEPDELVNNSSKSVNVQTKTSLKPLLSKGLEKDVRMQKKADNILDSSTGKKELSSRTNELLKHIDSKGMINIPKDGKPKLQDPKSQTMTKAAVSTTFQKPKESLQSLQLKSHDSSNKEEKGSSLSAAKKSGNSQTLKLVPHQCRKKLAHENVPTKSSNSAKISKAEGKGKSVRKEDIFASDDEQPNLPAYEVKSSASMKEKHNKEIARSRIKELELSADKRPRAYKLEAYETRTVHLKSKYESEKDKKADLRKKINALIKSKRERSRSPTYQSKSKNAELSPSRDKKSYRSYEADHYSPRYKSSRHRSYDDSPSKYSHDSPRSYSREGSARDDFHSRKRRRSSRSPKRRSPTGYWDDGSPRKDSYERSSRAWSRSRSPSDDFERRTRKYSSERSPGLHRYRKALRIPSEDTYLSDDSRGSPVTHASERSTKPHGSDYHEKKDSSRRSRRDIYDKLSHEARGHHSPPSRKSHRDFSEKSTKASSSRTKKEEPMLESMHSPINSPEEKIDDVVDSPSHLEEGVDGSCPQEKQATSKNDELAEFFRRLEQNKKVINAVQGMDSHSFNVSSSNNCNAPPSPTTVVPTETSGPLLQTPMHSQPIHFPTEVSQPLYAPSYSYCTTNMHSTSHQYSNVDLSYNNPNIPPQYSQNMPPYNPYVAPPPPPQYYSSGSYYMPPPPPPVSQPDINPSIGVSEISSTVLSDIISKASFKTLKKAATRVRSLKEVPVELGISKNKHIPIVSDDTPSESLLAQNEKTDSPAVPEESPQAKSPEISPEVSPTKEDKNQPTYIHQTKLELYKKLINRRSQVKFEIEELTVKVEKYRTHQSYYKKKHGCDNLSLKQLAEKAEIELQLLIEKEKKFSAKLEKMKDKINSDSGPPSTPEANKTEEVKPKVECEVKYFFYDSGNHWCQLCNEVFKTLPQKLEHLLTPKHKQLMDPFERPWSAPVKEETPTRKTGIIKKRQAVKGSEFVLPVEGFYCSICKESFPDELHAEHHLKSYPHYVNYKTYLVENPEYERRYSEAMLAGVSVLESERKRKVSEDIKAMMSKRRKNKDDSDSKTNDGEKTLRHEEDNNKDEMEKLENIKRSKAITLHLSGVKSKVQNEKKPCIPTTKASPSAPKPNPPVVYIGKAPNYWSRIAAKGDKNAKNIKKESPSREYANKKISEADLSTSWKTSSLDLPKASTSKDQQVKGKDFDTYGPKTLAESVKIEKETNNTVNTSQKDVRKTLHTSNTKAGDSESKTPYNKSFYQKNASQESRKGIPASGAASVRDSECKSGNSNAQNSRNGSGVSKVSGPTSTGSTATAKGDSNVQTAVDKAIKNILYGEKPVVVPLCEIKLPEVPKTDKNSAKAETKKSTTDMQKVSFTIQNKSGGKAESARDPLTEEERDFLLLGINKDDMKPLAIPKRPPDFAISSQADVQLPVSCQAEPMDLDPPSTCETPVSVNYPSVNSSASSNVCTVLASAVQVPPTNVLPNSAQQPCGVMSSTSTANVGMPLNSNQELLSMNVPPPPPVCNSNILRDNLPPFPPPLQVPPPNVVMRSHTPDVIQQQQPIAPSPTANVGYGSGISGGMPGAAPALNSYPPPPMQPTHPHAVQMPHTTYSMEMTPSLPHNQVPEFPLSGQHNMHSQSLEFTNVSNAASESNFDQVYQALVQGIRPPHGSNYAMQSSEEYYGRRPIRPPMLETPYSTNNVISRDHMCGSPYNIDGRKSLRGHPRPPANAGKSFAAKRVASVSDVKSVGSSRIQDAGGEEKPHVNMPKEVVENPKVADSVETLTVTTVAAEVKAQSDTKSPKSDTVVQAATEDHNKEKQEAETLSTDEAAIVQSGKSNSALDSSDSTATMFSSDDKIESIVPEDGPVNDHSIVTKEKVENVASSLEVSVPVKDDAEKEGVVDSSVSKEADHSAVLDTTSQTRDELPNISAERDQNIQNSADVDSNSNASPAVAMIADEDMEQTVVNIEGDSRNVVPVTEQEIGKTEVAKDMTAETVDHIVECSEAHDELQHEASDVVCSSDTMPELTVQTSDLNSCNFESENKDQSVLSASETSNDIPVLTKSYFAEEKTEVCPLMADVVPCVTVPDIMEAVDAHTTGGMKQKAQSFTEMDEMTSHASSKIIENEVEIPVKTAEADITNVVSITEDHLVTDKDEISSSMVESADPSMGESSDPSMPESADPLMVESADPSLVVSEVMEVSPSSNIQLVERTENLETMDIDFPATIAATVVTSKEVETSVSLETNDKMLISDYEDHLAGENKEKNVPRNDELLTVDNSILSNVAYNPVEGGAPNACHVSTHGKHTPVQISDDIKEEGDGKDRYIIPDVDSLSSPTSIPDKTAENTMLSSGNGEEADRTIESTMLSSGNEEKADETVVNAMLSSGKDEEADKTVVNTILSSGNEEEADKTVENAMLSSGNEEKADKTVVNTMLSSGKDEADKTVVNTMLSSVNEEEADKTVVNTMLSSGNEEEADKTVENTMLSSGNNEEADKTVVNTMLNSGNDEVNVSDDKDSFIKDQKKGLLTQKVDAMDDFSVCDVPSENADTGSCTSIKSDLSLQTSGSADHVDSSVSLEIGSKIENRLVSCNEIPMTEAGASDVVQGLCSSPEGKSEWSTLLRANYSKKDDSTIPVSAMSAAFATEEYSLISNPVTSDLDATISHGDTNMTFSTAIINSSDKPVDNEAGNNIDEMPLFADEAMITEAAMDSTSIKTESCMTAGSVEKDSENSNYSKAGFETEDQSISTKFAAVAEHKPVSATVLTEEMEKTEEIVKPNTNSLPLETSGMTIHEDEISEDIMLDIATNVPPSFKTIDESVNASLIQSELCEEKQQMNNAGASELNLNRRSDSEISAEPSFEAEDRGMNSELVAIVEDAPCSEAVFSEDVRKTDENVKPDTSNLPSNTNASDTSVCVNKTDETIVLQDTSNTPTSMKTDEECVNTSLMQNEQHEEKQQWDSANVTRLSVQIERCSDSEISAEAGKIRENAAINEENVNQVEDICTPNQSEAKLCYLKTETFQKCNTIDENEENLVISQENSGPGTDEVLKESLEDQPKQEAAGLEEKYIEVQPKHEEAVLEEHSVEDQPMHEEAALDEKSIKDQPKHEEAALEESQTTPSCMPTIHSYDDNDETSKSLSEEPPLLELAEEPATKGSSIAESDNVVEMTAPDISDVQESSQDQMECVEEKPSLEEPLTKAKGKATKPIMKSSRKKRKRRMTTRSMKNKSGDSSSADVVNEDDKMDEDTDEYECVD